MAYGFGDEFLSDLRSRCDIESIVSRYVELRRSGSDFVALCPFHSERTPSFHVSTQKQMFYCFGCGTGGDVITFIMKIENLSFPEAVRHLADIAGIKVPQKDFMDTELAALRKKVYDINREAARFYYNYMISPSGTKGLEYFHSRYLKTSTIKHFGLGYAPPEWDALSKYLIEKGYVENDIVAAGLAIRNNSGKIFDRFRDRAMFPIINHRGNVVGFGGRTFDKDSPAKYLNTSDTIVFKKQENLFAINFAKDSKAPQIIICEGYMDVISLHQAGFTSAVAALGTAFTPKQALLLKRYNPNIAVCFDSDGPGKKATARSIDILEANGLSVKVLTIQGGKDPDELMKTDKGPEIFKKMLTLSPNSTEYKIMTTKQKYNLTLESEKALCMKELIGILAGIPGPVERDIYTEKIAHDMGVKTESISAELNRLQKKLNSGKKREENRKLLSELQGRNNKINPQKQKWPKVAKIEEDIISILLNYPEKIQEVEQNIHEEDFVTDFNRRVFNAVSEKIKQNPSGEHMNMLSKHFEPSEISYIYSFISDINAMTVSPETIKKLCAELKDQRTKIIQSGFASDESFEAQIQKIRMRKNGH